MDDLGEQFRLDEQQLAVRRERDDVLSTPRTIDHTAYFRRRSAARSAASTLIRLGYSAEVSGRRTRVLLQAHRCERLDDDNPKRFVTEVFTAVVSAGGTYDGWGAMGCAPEKPRSRPKMYFDVMPEDIPPSAFGYVLTFEGGRQFVGVTRNLCRRVPSHARRRGIPIVKLGTVSAEGMTAEQRQILAQQLINKFGGLH